MLQRSQTAPELSKGIRSQTRPNGAGRLLQRSSSSAFLAGEVFYSPSFSGSGSLASNVDTDPFHLSGFYPRERQEEGFWSWITGGNLQQLATVELDETIYDGGSTPEDGHESNAEALIAREDKLGVLRLDTEHLLWGSSYDDENRLISPYMIDESVDDEALYLSVSRQRTRKGQLGVNGGLQKQKNMTIFFGNEEPELGTSAWFFGRVFE